MDSHRADHRLLHVWIPDMESAKGGIQAFSTFFIQALRELFPEARIDVFAKNDRSIDAQHTTVAGARFHCTGRWPAKLRTLGFSVTVIRHALFSQPDLILSTHVNFTPVALWLKHWARFPYVAVAHGMDVWGDDRRHLARALRGADRILAVSNHTRNRLLTDFALDPAKIGRLPNTFEPARFAPADKPAYLLERFGLTREQPVIFTVCRLARAERYKGYDQVLQALPQIRHAIPDVRYILGGTGPDRVRIKALIKGRGLDDSVILPGFIPDAELPDFYNLCDVFAMPSSGEGFGIVFLEALACGKPVLAGNKDGSVDALLQSELGALVNPDDIPAISKALIELLTGHYPLSILREPHLLRSKVINAYGYPRFRETLGEQLSALLDWRPRLPCVQS